MKKGKQFELPVYYDVEEKSQLALGKEKVSAIIRKFLNTVEIIIGGKKYSGELKKEG